MANLVDSHKFSTFDDYYTPKSAWEYIAHLIPKDKIIWEAFCLNSKLSKSIKGEVAEKEPKNFANLSFSKKFQTDYDYFLHVAFFRFHHGNAFFDVFNVFEGNSENCLKASL